MQNVIKINGNNPKRIGLQIQYCPSLIYLVCGGVEWGWDEVLMTLQAVFPWFPYP